MTAPGGRIGLGSSFCLRSGGSSFSLSLSASLVAPVDDVASARPLNVSSSVEAEVRPCEMLDISPSLINCSATSLSSSDMQLLIVGSGVGKTPEPGVALVEPCEGYPFPPRERRVLFAGVAYMPDCP